MAQHISVRVPWHDNGWNGTVCQFPGENNACLRLKNIYENRNDAEEIDILRKAEPIMWVLLFVCAPWARSNG